MEEIIKIKDIINKEIIQPIINTIVTKYDPITCLVLSGGSIRGVCTYGALYEAKELGVFDLKNINTIYATSVGTLIGCLLSMKFEWNDYTNYIVKRPWHKIFNIDIKNILNSFESCGIFDKSIIFSIVEPFLKARDLSQDITLEEFYETTQVDFHFFITEINAFECIDVSYTTHPKWKLIDAIYTSCSLPILFPPFFHENNWYADGSLTMNYPIEKCIEKIGIENEHKILGICIEDIIDEKTETKKTETKKIETKKIETEKTETDKTKEPCIKPNQMNLVEYMFSLFSNLIKYRIFKNNIIPKYTYNFHIPFKCITLEDLNNIVRNADERNLLIKSGKDGMNKMMKTKFIHSKSLQ